MVHSGAEDILRVSTPWWLLGYPTNRSQAKQSTVRVHTRKTFAQRNRTHVHGGCGLVNSVQRRLNPNDTGQLLTAINCCCVCGLEACARICQSTVGCSVPLKAAFARADRGYAAGLQQLDSAAKRPRGALQSLELRSDQEFA